MKWGLRWRQMQRELVEEVRAHLEEAVEVLMADGMSRPEALAAARRQFGNPTLIEERAREVWRWRLVDELLADLRYAIRQLRRAPAFTVASVLTLAVGIGANTAVFSVVDAVILRPLPFPDPDRLVSVQSRSTRGGPPHPEDLSYPTFFDFRSRNHVFEHVVSFRDTTMGLSGAGDAINLEGQIVSWGLFAALHVQPALGRGFLPEEEKAGRRVVVLSHALWKERFGADPNLVGRTIALDRQPYTVVGVAPKGFNFPIGQRQVQIWTTLAVDAASATVTPMTEQRGARLLEAFARLQPRVSMERARAEMDGIAAALGREYPDQNRNVAGTYVQPELDTVLGDARVAILILFGAVTLVLLVTCANVANLLLARTTERQREFAVRASIGASRGRIVRQLLAESLAFALAGSAAGVLVAAGCVRITARLAAESIPRIEQAGIDGRVLAFSIGLAFVTCLLFSLAPALRVARIDLAGPLREGARGMTRGGHRLRGALVVVQIALGLVLLSGAAVLGAGFLHLLRRDAGFRPENLVSFSVSLPQSSTRGAGYQEFESRLRERLAALPGVVSAANALPLPLSGHQVTIAFNIEERPSVPSQRPYSDMAIVSPNYFRTLGLPLLEGREFTERDDAQGAPVLIVNRAFADKFFPGERAVGKRILPGATGEGVRGGMREIVGVVGNARQSPLGVAPDPVYYYTEKQLPWCCGSYVVRTTGSPLALEASIRGVVAALDRNVPVYRVRTLEDLLEAGIAQPRFGAFLLSAFAAIALLLTAVGLYGVLAYSVLSRTREIGVRVALGATRRDVLAMVLREAMLLVLVGSAIGVAGAMAGDRLARGMMPGFTLPQTSLLALACGVVLLTALIAAYVPARRAASVDPVRALRME